MNDYERRVLDRGARTIKMEIMVNIEGICNNLKGTTKFQRFSFGIDIRKLPITLFLLKAKAIIFDRKYRKRDIIVFYDDTLLRIGTKGFGIVEDHIVTNVGGFMREITFQEMEHEPEYVKGFKKDVIRIYYEGNSHDIKVQKDAPNIEKVFDIMSLLFEHSRIIMEENKKAYRVRSGVI